jgi:phage tail protein X
MSELYVIDYVPHCRNNFFNPSPGENMTLKQQLSVTIGCLLFLSCFWLNVSGMFDQITSADPIFASTNKSSSATEKDTHNVVFKEAGGSLYAIAMQHYQRANETLFDLIVQANPGITNVRQIGDDQTIALPVITPESYLVKTKDAEFQVHIATFEIFETAVEYSQKMTQPEKLLFVESREFSPQDTWYRLTMGDFKTREEALKTVNLLKEASLIYIPSPALKNK